VIGAPYLVYVAKTKSGDIYSGILVEKSDKQLVLKDQTKQMVIPANDLEKADDPEHLHDGPRAWEESR